MAQRKAIIAFDGEAVKDNYSLLASSDGETLYQRRGLGPLACLDFLTRPELRHTLNVWFSFNYDVNMILKGLGDQDFWQGRRAMLLNQYKIQYFPEKILKVKRGRETFTHYDVFGFFQTSFRQAIKSWLNVTDEVIDRGKQKRSDFAHWSKQELIEYNGRELVYLVQLVDKLRDIFDGLDIPIHLKHWHGAGAAAQAALTYAQLHTELEGIDPRVEEWAINAYFGGRVETVQRGAFRSAWRYDIRSAYPYAMLDLPDLSASVWKQSKTLSRWGVYRVQFDNGVNTLGAFPVRLGSGLITFPKEGAGVYWGYEVLAALLQHVDVKILAGLVPSFHPVSKLRGLIRELYRLRESYRDQHDPREKAVKLMLNAMYGKLAQKEGGRFHSLAWAGMVTAHTRATVYQVAMQDPENVLAFATDGIFTLKPLSVDQGRALGQWEVNRARPYRLVMNGIYQYGDEYKTRGFNLPADQFDAIWQALIREGVAHLQSRRFIPNSLHLLQSQAYPDPCVWRVGLREINPGHDVKRCWPGLFDGTRQRSAPLLGGVVSFPYVPADRIFLDDLILEIDET